MNTAFRASVNFHFPWGNEGLRYTFNGKETDTETDLQDYGMRIYNPRLGKFLSVDPLTQRFAMLTPYQYASNRPIDCIDLDGLESVHYSSYFQSRIGGVAIMQLLNHSGLKKEIEESFATQVGLSTQKYDLYFVFIPDAYYPQSTGARGFTDSFSRYEDMQLHTGGVGGYSPLYFLGIQGMGDQVKQSFADGKQVQLVVLNQDYLDILTGQVGNGQAFQKTAASMALTMYHEYKLHVEDNLNGDKRSAIDDHKYGYGKDYNSSYDAQSASPSYDEIKDMASVMGVAKGKIEYVIDQAKKQEAAQQQKNQVNPQDVPGPCDENLPQR